MTGMSVWMKTLFVVALVLGVAVVVTQATLMVLWELGYWDGPYA